jgi:hypothetical protein
VLSRRGGVECINMVMELQQDHQRDYLLKKRL